MKSWLEKDNNIVRLNKLRGMSNKPADYLKILDGIPTSAIDRHLIEFIKQTGIDREAREIINKTAKASFPPRNVINLYLHYEGFD